MLYHKLADGVDFELIPRQIYRGFANSSRFKRRKVFDVRHEQSAVNRITLFDIVSRFTSLLMDSGIMDA